MKEVVYEPVEEMISWAEAHTRMRYRPDAKAIGIRDETGYRGIVVFDSFTKTGCWVHVASDGSRKWITRELIIRTFAYPFIRLEYPRINAFVSVDNHDAVAFNENFGWTREGVLREGGENGEDLILFGMLRRECRWLPERFSGKIGRPIL